MSAHVACTDNILVPVRDVACVHTRLPITLASQCTGAHTHLHAPTTIHSTSSPLPKEG